METSLTPAQQEVEMTLHLHGPSILNLIGSTFYKLGGDEHWAGRGFRRIFNYLCARTAIDFGSEASEQSTVVHKEVYRSSPHDLRKPGRHSYMQPDQFYDT